MRVQLSMLWAAMKNFKKINSGTKFASIENEEGWSLLEKNANAEMESDESAIESTSMSLINGNHIDYADATTNANSHDSDSSSSSLN